jgi:hypothetical protein
MRHTGIGIITTYVTRKRSRLYRFGRNHRHFIYVTFRMRFAAARAGRADRVDVCQASMQCSGRKRRRAAKASWASCALIKSFFGL